MKDKSIEIERKTWIEICVMRQAENYNEIDSIFRGNIIT